MLDDPYLLSLPRAGPVQATAAGVTRHYLRRLEAQRNQRDLCIWEGEGGKLAAAVARRGRSGISTFSATLPA
jgi:hypothetical protein